MGKHTQFNLKRQPKSTQSVVDKQRTTERKRRINYLSGKTTIRYGAIHELQQPDLIYILGGQPVYIHSTIRYFEEGAKTATKELQKYLEAMVIEQKTHMAKMSNYVRQLWNIKLKRLFPGGEVSSFEEFQNLWNKSVAQHGEGTTILGLMRYLAMAKEAITKHNALKFEIDQARQSTKQAAAKEGRVVTIATTDNSKKDIFNPNQSDVAMMNKKLFPFGITVELEATSGGKTHYSFLGDTADAYRQLRKDYETWVYFVLDEIEKNKHLFEAGIYKKIMDIKSKSSISNLDFGNLFELIADGLQEKVAIDLEENAPTSFFIRGKNIAAEKHSDSAIINKADTMFTITMNIDDKTTEESFVFSDKSGQEIIRELNGKDLIKNKTVDVFTSSLDSDSYDFTNYRIDSSKVTAENGVKIQSLTKYVLYNESAFYNTKKASSIADIILNYKKLVVQYAAWLKVGAEIVGQTTEEDKIPLAIRTIHSIYNTADLLDYFIDLPVADILKFTFKSSGNKNNIYEKTESLTNLDRETLFLLKKNILFNMLYDSYKDGSKTNASYRLILNNSVFSEFLKSINSKFKMKSLGLSLRIKMNNMAIRK